VNVQVISVEQYDGLTRGFVIVDGVTKAFQFKAPLDHSKLTPQDLRVVEAVAAQALRGRPKP
jgi:hypothetical protein